MRDPFANYDSWKTTDVEGENAQAYADYVAREGKYEMACCGFALGTGEDADVTFDRKGNLLDRVCPNPECEPDATEEQRTESVIQTIPDPPYDGPDGPDEDR